MSKFKKPLRRYQVGKGFINTNNGVILLKCSHKAALRAYMAVM